MISVRASGRCGLDDVACDFSRGYMDFFYVLNLRMWKKYFFFLIHKYSMLLERYCSYETQFQNFYFSTQHNYIYAINYYFGENLLSLDISMYFISVFYYEKLEIK